MSNSSVNLIGKPVKDMYGSHMGKVAGAITNIDGSIQAIGVDCGHSGLRQISYEQLVPENDAVIFIPRWRLDSQKLFVEKGTTMRRLKALMEIVSENDDMKDDATIVYEQYKIQLTEYNAKQQLINTELESRLVELDGQLKMVKTIVFDARIRAKSQEIETSIFESVREHTTSLIEHIMHETTEIQGVQRRMADLDAEVEQTLTTSSEPLQDSAMSYLGSEQEVNLPKVPPMVTVPSSPVSPIQASFDTQSNDAPVADPKVEPEETRTTSEESQDTSQDELNSDWLDRMQTQ